MVMQYRLKGTARWKDYPGKKFLDRPTSSYQWRLLNEKKTKKLWPAKKEYSTYDDVLSNMRRIEFFKHRSSFSASDFDLYSQISKSYKIQSFFPEQDYIPKINSSLRLNAKRKNCGSMKTIFKRYKTGKKQGGQRYHIMKKYSYLPASEEDKLWDRLMIQVEQGKLSLDEAIAEYSLKTKGGKKK